jgi:signal peptidase I
MKNLFSSDLYSLKKCKHALRHSYHAFLKKKHTLSSSESQLIENNLFALQTHILEKDRPKASSYAKKAEELFEAHLKPSQFQRFKNSAITLGLALCAAVVIRQCWFELYEIPTGSMRPTLKEKDRLFVSKTAFGINIPLTTKHVMFNQDLIERNGIFVFTGENMDIRDVDTTYFYIFHGKKQYIKRLIGKPGDTLYFYGGQIYGVDAKGNDITQLLQPNTLEKIEHIPFIYFDGKIMSASQPIGGIFSPITILQMNEPVARLYLNNQNQVVGEMLSQCTSASSCQPPLQDYSDLWGFRNFGMSRLLTKEQVKFLYDENTLIGTDTDYYLEIKHHPSLKSAKLSRDERGRLRPVLGISSSILPVDETHLKKIFENLYTARFIVKNGFAYRYGASSQMIGKGSYLPRLPGVPDGTYEFYYGKAYQIKWQGISEELPASHPLYTFSKERVQMLYNLGIEFDTRFSPQTKMSPIPSRYAYFKEGHLYLMGASIFSSNEEILQKFIINEQQKQLQHSSQYPYAPFIDYGAPIKADGSLDRDFIMHYGLTIPEKGYLALGDNHAMSADSRDFGFVPEDNIRGAPDFIFWPFGSRWGYPDQPAYPFFNLPRSILWLIIGSGLGIYYIRHRKKNLLPFPLHKKEG